jgi:hypothetical protein
MEAGRYDLSPTAMQNFQRWCEAWATECLRILKPGGHLLAFGGARTWHRLAGGIEDAGFEIRDSVAWLYSQGFPKSLNVSRDERFCQCATRGSAGGAEARNRPLEQVSAADVPGVRSDLPPLADEATRNSSADLLSAVPGQAGRGSAEVRRGEGARGLDLGELGVVSGEDVGRRESGVEGRRDGAALEGELRAYGDGAVPTGHGVDAAGEREDPAAPSGDGEVDRPSVDAARVRESHRSRHGEQRAVEPGALADERGSQARRGWPTCGSCGKPQVAGLGTALKPSFEPIVVARKPLVGTVAANVLAHGTGAINIDAARIPTTQAERDLMEATAHPNGTIGGNGGGSVLMQVDKPDPFTAHLAGRWPSNVVLDESQADELDRQSGVSQSTIGKPRGAKPGDGWGMSSTGSEYADAGGVSRFFPTFRYEAKAPTSERPRDGEVLHPTVKPLDLMRWLVRLVTPAGGVVLEPFAGSGTTLEACVREGFEVIGIEREADYIRLIQKRLGKDHQQSLFGDWDGAE